MNYRIKAIALAAIGVLAFNQASANASTLIGDSIDVTLSGGITLEDFGVLVGPGVELEGGNAATNWGDFLFPGEFIDIGATTITMMFDLSLGMDGMLTFGDLDFGSGIGSVVLTSNNPAVTQANISFTSNSITMDFTEWFTAGGEGAFQLEISEVPVPAAIWLFIGALGSLRLLNRKK